MNKHEIFGRDLYDAQQRIIATARGKEIYDSNNRRVATIRGDEVFDTDQRMIATVRGSDIYDAGCTKVGTFTDVQKSIEGAAVGILHVALWYCFVR